MVALTDTARVVIRRLMDRAGGDQCGLRIVVEEGGCFGLQYRLAIEPASRAGDEIYDFGGIRLFVDPFSLPMLDGIRIDFVEGVQASGFVFDNPNAGNRCQCGKSFAC